MSGTSAMSSRVDERTHHSPGDVVTLELYKLSGGAGVALWRDHLPYDCVFLAEDGTQVLVLSSRTQSDHIGAYFQYLVMTSGHVGWVYERDIKGTVQDA